MLFNILIILLVVLLDQVTKYITVEVLAEIGSYTVIENVLKFTYVENRGAAFGMLSEHRWVFMLLSVVGIVLLFVYLSVAKPKSWWARLSLCFIIGGGVGNMIDRAVRKFVVDMINFCAFDFWKWVFNVADAFVCVGCAMFIIAVFVEEYRAVKEKKAAAAATDEPENGDANE